MLIIGIDVGLGPKNTGFAQWTTSGKALVLRAYSFWEAQAQLMELKKLWGTPCVVLEDASLDRVTFKKGTSQAVTNKLSRDAGKNQGGAIIIKQMCKALDIPCLCIAPSKRQRASKHQKRVDMLTMPTKTSYDQFKALTGYGEKKGNNEHSRDAATLVWGMTEAEFNKRLKLQGL